MASSMGIVIHCPFDIGFVPRGGGDVLVSRPQLRLRRYLVICWAKQQLVGDSIPLDANENFPRLPDTKRLVELVSATPQGGRYDAKKLKALSRVSEAGPCGSRPPLITYLLDLGFDLEQIKMMADKYPSFSHYTLEGNIRPLIEFLLDLGAPKSDLPKILIRFPRLCGMSLSKNVIPTLAFLETLGVDKSKWVKLISRFPAVFTNSRKKIEAVVEFLHEVGLSHESIGKILTRFPQILGHSVEDKLRPSVEYFRSLGVDVAAVLRSYPKILGLSIEANVKPSTEFFLENGFSIEEVGTMISRSANLYTLSVKGNLVPKWELFLTLDYRREDLVKYPQYFGCSLEERIKPRYNLMKESGVKLSLSQLLCPTSDKFELLLKNKIEKLQLKERY